MEIKIIKVTDKGQISLPIDIRSSLNICAGDRLLVVPGENSIIMKKIETANFRDLLKHSEKVASKLWDNEEDEIWNNV